MKFRGLRSTIAFIIVGCTMIGLPALATERTVIARIDLGDRQDFEQYRNLGMPPFFRIDNVFFAELNQGELSAIRRANITLEIVDNQPFSGRYYFSRTESIVSRNFPATGMERLAEVGEYALYKSAEPINRALFRRHGFDPAEITKREIPLVYFPVTSANPDISLLTNSSDLDSLIGEVSFDSVYAYNTRLEAFQTRFSFTDSNVAAREWARQKFEDFGYTDITFQEFWADAYLYTYSGWAYNIICRKPGIAEPDKVIIIGAHYDTMILDGNDPLVYAPGADDDGSGTAVTIEIARVLAGIDNRKTIIFLLFGAEEQYIVGSWYYANYAASIGMDIELMINLDMIGYTEGGWPGISCFYYGPSRPYTELMASLGNQYTWADPVVAPSPGAADHLPFYQNGYNIAYNQEGIFNLDGWHTELDITARMDFPFMTEVTKMALATAYTVDFLPAAVDDAVAQDVGDGQSLRVTWTASPAPDVSGYRVYWGTSSTNYTNSQFVPGSSSSEATLNGLIDNQLYYLTVVAIGVGDLESLLRPEFTGTPRLVPLPPSGVVAEIEKWRIDLFWEANQELDFDFYRIYRAAEPGSYSLLVDHWGTLSYIDTDVEAGVMYDYVITAVDVDQYESEFSEAVRAAAATFDQGILIIDQTRIGAGNPTAEEKEAFFAAAFTGIETSYYYYDPLAEELSKSIIGQYETIFWFDDDNAAGYWNPDDLNKLRWFLGYNTNMVLAGWRTAFEFADLGVPKTIYPGNLLYDYVGINYIDQITDKDFVGALGETLFPDVDIDPDKVYPSWQGKMGWIGVLGLTTINNGIYTFDSYSGNHSGRIVGARRDNGTNKFAFLSIPFYYLQENDAQALIGEMLTWFGSIPECDCAEFGDLNRDGNINPVDVVFMVNYVYLGQNLLQSIPQCYQGELARNGDWNCDGAINPVDVVLIVNKVYLAGPDPCDPCLCDPYPSNCP